TSIPRNVRLAEAPSHGKPALVYDVRSRGAESYIRLAKEILDAEAARRQQAAEAQQESSSAADAGAPVPAPVEECASPTPEAPLAVAPAEPVVRDQLEQGIDVTELILCDLEYERLRRSAAVPQPDTMPAATPPATIADAGPAGSAADPRPTTDIPAETVSPPPERYPSLPPPAVAEAVMQAAQAPTQPAVEQGD
ncbi:MAG TPA: hypothetical protein VKT29_14570, partial [Terriglobales bacterium]|nr:hypothetical protein [Terriglobales bacterium]